MLERIKSSIVPLAIATSVLFFVSTTSAADNSGQATAPGKLRSCQARESAVKTRMSHLVQLATNMMNKFDRHATRVETFYTKKVVPSGKTVSNYDSLVADINTKKTAVQSALTKAQNDVNGFSCTNGDPKALLTQFRQDMQATKQALKDYRTSIKNLIVAVRGIVGGEASESGAMKK